MASPPTPPSKPLAAWIEQERRWGGLATQAIARQRREVSRQRSGLERFATRMSLVDLTGSVARWADGLRGGLERAGHLDAAARFAASPPFAAADPTGADCDRLTEYVQARVEILDRLLRGEPS